MPKKNVWILIGFVGVGSPNPLGEETSLLRLRMHLIETSTHATNLGYLTVPHRPCGGENQPNFNR